MSTQKVSQPLSWCRAELLLCAVLGEEELQEHAKACAQKFVAMQNGDVDNERIRPKTYQVKEAALLSETCDSGGVVGIQAMGQIQCRRSAKDFRRAGTTGCAGGSTSRPQQLNALCGTERQAKSSEGQTATKEREKAGKEGRKGRGGGVQAGGQRCVQGWEDGGGAWCAASAVFTVYA